MPEDPHRKLPMKSFCEGAFTLAPALTKCISKSRIFQEAFEFVGATELENEDPWQKKFNRTAADIEELKKDAKAQWGVDATKPDNFEGVDIAIIAAPYANSGGAGATKMLVKEIADAAEAKEVPWVILIGRHDSKGPNFGRTELYQGLLHHRSFKVVKTYFCNQTRSTSVIQGYHHDFTGGPKKVIRDMGIPPARMFVASLKLQKHQSNSSPVKLTPRVAQPEYARKDPLVWCLKELVEEVKLRAEELKMKEVEVHQLAETFTFLSLAEGLKHDAVKNEETSMKTPAEVGLFPWNAFAKGGSLPTDATFDAKKPWF